MPALISDGQVMACSRLNGHHDHSPFSPASLFLASSSSGMPGSAFFQRSRILLSNLKMLPFVFHALHKLLEALLATNLLKKGVVLCEQGIIEHYPIHSVFQPIQSRLPFLKVGIETGRMIRILAVPLERAEYAGCNEVRDILEIALQCEI